MIFHAAVASLLLGPLAYWLARRAGLFDVPGSAPHKTHNETVPIAGGMVFMATVFLVSAYEGIFDTAWIRQILLPCAIVFSLGLVDDARGLSPMIKISGQLLATVLLINAGVQVRLFGQEWINYAITVAWMIGVTNAYNFVDSMDGLATGLAGLASAFFMLVTIDSNQAELAIFSAILLGACIGSFYFNSSPAYYFLGDSGSQLLGFMLAALGIAYTPIGFTRLSSWFIPILLAGVPIFDACLVIVSRIRRRKPIYKPARDHTYHRLVARGISPNRAVMTMHMGALLLGLLAFNTLRLPPLLANGVFASIVLSAMAAIAILDMKKYGE